MKSRLRIILPFVFTVFLAAGIYIGSRMNINNSAGRLFSVKYTEREKLYDVINYITNDYVDKVDRKELTEKTIEDMLSHLDPHSSYIPPVELDEVEESMNGNFFGIGIQFRRWQDTVVVVRTIKDGPSERQGVMSGDRLISADGISLVGIENDSIIKLLKGPRGSEVIVDAIRPADGIIHEFKIVRGVIPYKSINSYYMAVDSTAYIKIDRFAATTYDEFRHAVDSLGLFRFENIIIDLRDNGGGLLSTAISLIDEFLPKGQIIVYTEGRKRKKDISYSTGRELMKGKNIVVMVNENSASASEIFAGAIQDNDRGIIIGRRTFGKGLVQEQITLADNSAIRLTVARYYTATGRCIQKPYNKGIEQYYHEINDRFIHGEMTNADSASFADSLMYRTGKGKIVYGGGGIMPDIYVPLDTSLNYLYYNMLQRSGTFSDFAFEYFDKNRVAILEKFPSEDDYVKNFKISDDMIKGLFKKGEENGIKPEKKLPVEMLKQIKVSLKAQLASDIYGMNAYFKVINPQDEIYKKALEYSSGR